jgi:hypothetical protein
MGREGQAAPESVSNARLSPPLRQRHHGHVLQHLASGVLNIVPCGRRAVNQLRCLRPRLPRWDHDGITPSSHLNPLRSTEPKACQFLEGKKLFRRVIRI